jgi:S-adenosylmethionine decarboxylase
LEPVVTEVMGDHYILEYLDCDPARIGTVDRVEPVLKRAIERCGATAVQFVFHQFAPAGVSATVLLAESHFCLHSWPERGYVAADVFTCGETMDARVAAYVLEEGFGAREVVIERIERGIPG